MSNRPVSRLTVPAGACVGLAGWCSWGVLTLTGSGPGSARAGVLPPWWTLAVFVAGAMAVMAVSRLPRERLLPLCATAVLVVPWLPVPMPAPVLAWAGPLGWFVWALALAGSIAAAPWPALSAGPWRTWLTAPRAPWLAAVLALCVYAAAGWRIAPVLPGGDEPHYLIITQSLLEDGDLRIENNHQRGDYLSYFSGVLKPDYLKRGVDGQIYSIHLPGVSVLAAPAFALGGYTLVKLWLAVLSALASAVAWRVAFTLARSAGGAWFAWAATALTAPFLFLAFTVYPDGPGGILVLAALAALVAVSRRADRPAAWWMAAGVAPALLPWFHPRFAVLAAAIGFVMAGRAAGQQKRAAAAAYLAAPIVSAAAWFAYYGTIYGTPNPSAAYGHYTQMAPANVWRGLVGLMVDHQFGLVATAPVYALAVMGVVALVRRERRLGLEWLVIVAPYAVVCAMYHMWWGGHSSPARFLGPVMLACVAPMAALWAASRHPVTRLMQAFLLAVSLAGAGMTVWVEQGRLAFNTRDGLAMWAVWASRSVDVARGFPSVFRTDASTAALSAAIWTGLIGAVWLAFRWLGGRTRTTRAGAALALAIGLVVAETVAIAATWRLEGVTGAAPASGQLALLAASGDAPDRVGVSYDPPSLGSARDTATKLRLDGLGLAGRPAWARLWLPRVPAGRYRVWFDNRVPGATLDIDVIIGRGEQAVETWRLADLPPGLTSREIVLPRAVRSLALRGDSAARTALRSVWIEAVAIAPVPPDGGTRITAARRYAGTVLMGAGDGVFLEDTGLWIAGDAVAEVFISAAPGANAQRMWMRGGPMPVGVELVSGGWRESLALAPGASREVDVPLQRDAATAVKVTTHGGFRPSQSDPASTDGRFLGVWMEPR